MHAWYCTRCNRAFANRPPGGLCDSCEDEPVFDLGSTFGRHSAATIEQEEALRRLRQLETWTAIFIGMPIFLGGMAFTLAFAIIGAKYFGTYAHRVGGPWSQLVALAFFVFLGTGVATARKVARRWFELEELVRMLRREGRLQAAVRGDLFGPDKVELAALPIDTATLEDMKRNL